MMEQKRLGDIATYINGYAFKQKIVVLKDFPLLEFKILQGILMMWVFIMENTLKKLKLIMEMS